MAKKPEVKSSGCFADDLMKIIGENDEHQGVNMWLDTGFPPLNRAISGSYKNGFPVGRIVEMFGPPSSGKTAIATNAMIEAQKAGGVAIFMDHERSFDVKLAAKNGLNEKFPYWIFKTPDTFESSVSTVMKAVQFIRENNHIPDTAPIVAVFDSLASMVPKSKFEKDGKERGVDEYNMNDNTALARATSAVMPALSIFCERYKFTAIFLNQARTKIGVMYGDPTTTPGGNAPEFYASVRIKLGKSQIVKGTGESKEVIGNQIGAQCVKNKVSRPFRKASWNFMFKEDGTGSFDVVGSMVSYLCDIGALEKSGPRINWVDGKSYFESQLVEKINNEGLYPELLKLLPDEKVVEESDPDGVEVSEDGGEAEA